MDAIELAKSFKEFTIPVNVFLRHSDSNLELISSGSAVSISSSGILLTAAHVLTGRLPITDRDVKDENVVILVQVKNVGIVQFEAPLVGLSFTLPPYLRRPIDFDLAILRPVKVLPEAIPFVEISDTIPEIGTQVMMAGFSDDIRLPLEFDSALNRQHPQVRSQLPILEVFGRQLMVRSGMIGHITGLNVNDRSNNVERKGAEMYIDNVLHAGASGGPVIDGAGRLIGIITMRAMTDVPYEDTPKLRVPSGAAVGLSPLLIAPELSKLGIPQFQ